jgi:4-hydroxy-tetrahydrodipicolinate reductase
MTVSAPIKIVVLGTGQMGAGIIQRLLQKTDLELVGVYGRRAQRAGLDVGQVLGQQQTTGIQVTNDLPTLLNQTRPHVAIQATCSRVAQAMDEITTMLRHGVNVISIAEEMAYPAYAAPHAAHTINTLALDNDATVVGAGINPGFVFDLLIIALTGVCFRVESITATRVNDLSPYGPSVLTGQGVGLTPQAFEQGIADGTVVGHIGFPESIGMIANALGWRINRIMQQREVIVSTVRRETPFVTIEPGQTAGCTHSAIAYVDEAPVIHLIHPQQVHPQLENVATGDRIDIHGEPDVHLTISPEIPGGIGTVALAVNMIPQVINAAPGLQSMRDLPVPAAFMGDVRTLLHNSQVAEHKSPPSPWQGSAKRAAPTQWRQRGPG